MREELDQLIARCKARYIPDAVPQWVLPPASCEFLGAVADVLPPGSSAFEFGSGRSTHALRRVFSAVTSVESSERWLDETEQLHEAIAKRALDRPSVVALRRLWNRARLIQSFPIEKHINLLHSLGAARLILVDSPPNPAKREHALFLSMRSASVGAVIVIDDLEISATARYTMRLARQNRSRFHFWHLPIDHQLGVFLKASQGTIRSRPSPREFIGTWLRA